MCIVAVVMSLIGSANLAMALPDDGVVTGSQANTDARANGGEYFIHGR
jgi:hypothetical protein